MKKTKKAVFFVLIFVTVVSPIVFYTDRVATFSSSFGAGDGFGEEISTFAVSGGTRQNVMPQENPTILKEPVGIIYSAKQELQSKSDTPVEHRNRVLSTAVGDDGHSSLQSKENLIKQVTEVKRDSLLKQPEKEAGTEQLSSGKGHLEILSEQPKKIDVKDSAAMKAGIEKRSQPQGMPNAQIRYLKDQLVRAKVYLSLTAARNNVHFLRELRQRMKEIQRVLGDATKDSELPKNAYDKLKVMDHTLAKGKQIQDDCAVLVKKLRAILHSTEEQLRVHRKQTMFLTQLSAKTLPKGLHCLPLRLSTEYYAMNFSQQQFPNQDKLEQSQLYHYALFSDNVLATAAVVNSTVTHAKDPSRHVFHIVTDKLNYAAMRMWFLANPPDKATIEVQNVEEFTWLNSSYSPVLKQLGSPSMINYYFRAHHATSDSNLKFRNPKYLSILNHLRFYLPEIFPKLKKVLFLDDDIIVQKDLTGLWAIDLKGNVNGAVETCRESFHRFDRYLNFSNPLISKNFDPRACGWAYGMNIFDLEEWKRQTITEVYHTWQKLNHDRMLWKLGTLPPGLITFWKSTYPLDQSWHVLGLGYNPNVNIKSINNAAVIHYNGNMKPWLEIGMPKYRNYWSKYIDYDQLYLRECNISP